ncbi:hypothetical protein RHSIM_Rhsim07G0029100 [Rhododendron simsii]|uniref:Uncharacterized protein n=1 Tax=Rhododendron simsii TaxID=118357 RepID=A0A834LGW9_RHOSS|nr:hypothetical protein RHSIM_Rhsim07G0029100 [Rhododendron simsii]
MESKKTIQDGWTVLCLTNTSLTTGRRHKRPRQLEEDLVDKFSTMGECNPVTYLEGCRLPITPSGIHINLDVSPEYFFARVCCGGLITFPLQVVLISVDKLNRMTCEL